MSGGAFNYLCGKRGADLMAARNDVVAMRDYLAEQPTEPGMAEAIAALTALIDAIDHNLVDAMADRLEGVMKAVEWTCSSDWGWDSVRKALAAFAAAQGTPRQQAQAELDDLAARTLAARERLREAVRAEIRVLPAVADATTAEAACDALALVLGEPTYRKDDAGPNEAFSGWQIGRGGFHLHTKDLDEPIFLHVEGTEIVGGGWDVDETYIDVTATLDAAVKAALLWLADRDVFLPPRAP